MECSLSYDPYVYVSSTGKSYCLYKIRDGNYQFREKCGPCAYKSLPEFTRVVEEPLTCIPHLESLIRG